MKAFEEWWDTYSYYAELNEAGIAKETSKDTWKAALEHFNNLFLNGEHPLDVITEMQKELENE